MVSEITEECLENIEKRCNRLVGVKPTWTSEDMMRLVKEIRRLDDQHEENKKLKKMIVEQTKRNKEIKQLLEIVLRNLEVLSV